MTTLYLVRHGETVDNVKRIMQGQTQGELTENGCQQAMQVGENFASVAIDVYISSDLKRSIDTCRIIAGKPDVNIIQSKLLRERDWGSFTGKYIPELANLNNPDEWPKDIETLDELKARAAQFLAFVKENYENKTVLAVGHGIINKAIQSVYHNKPMNEIAVMKNADVRILEL